MNGTAQLKRPQGCTERERNEFARLVRQAFDGSDEGLLGRIGDAEWLAFYYAGRGTLAAIAGLKVPTGQYREEVFRRADAGSNPADYRLELGWVFVVPDHRRKRIGTSLCQRLLARVPASRVFATTRPDNDSMIGILRALGFVRVGKPYPHSRRSEELVLFLRS